MRPLLALVAAIAVALICYAVPAGAQSDQGVCYAKDTIVQKHAAPGVQFRKLVGEEADRFRAFSDSRPINAGKPDPETYTYVVFWHGRRAVALVYGFDQHNCAAYSQLLERESVLAVIGADPEA